MADLLPRLMTQEEARDCLDDIRVGTLKVKERLIELHERRGWEALSYPSWRECIEAELQISKSTAYRLLDAAYIQRGLSQNGKSLPDSHAMELKKVEPEKRAAALAKAKESAAAQGRAKPTAKDIREAVDSGSGTEPPHDATHQDDAGPRRAVMDGDSGPCPKGGEHDLFTIQGQRACGKCRTVFPADDYDDDTNEAEAEFVSTYKPACEFEEESYDDSTEPYDTTSLDEFCRWTIDQCEPQHREQLAARLAHWAKEAKGTK